MKIVIIGGGIMGLATAWAVRKLGCHVVLADQGALPNPLAASSDRSRAIRFAYGEMHGYAAMVAEAYEAWGRLWHDLGSTHYAETGHLLLGPPDDPWVQGSLSSLHRLGIPLETLDDRALRERFPMIGGKVSHGWLTAKAGVLFPDRLAIDLLAWLRHRGAHILEHFRAVEIDDRSGTVRAADGREIAGDVVLVAGGAWAGGIVPELQVRVQPSRQVVIYLRPPAKRVATWEVGPFVSSVDSVSGRFFYALPPTRGVPLKFGDHRPALEGDPVAPRIAQQHDIDAILELARGTLADIDTYAIETAKVCFYTASKDGRFVAGQRGRTYYVSACSGHGFKFGAVIGERTAELLTERLPFPIYRQWLSSGSTR